LELSSLGRELIARVHEDGLRPRDLATLVPAPARLCVEDGRGILLLLLLEIGNLASQLDALAAIDRAL